jgi:LPXTG-site transpeptidase (sortase) family protein
MNADNQLDETEITDEQKAEYTVPADQPRYIYIDKLGVNKARVLPMGVNSKGQMLAPHSIYDVAWYNKSAKPGKGKTTILNGHSGVGSSKGVFSKLRTLSAGDEIRIEMGDGTIYTYRVYDNFAVRLDEANKKMSMLQTSPVAGTESISIITCTGEYSLKQKTYLSRQFLRATRVD